MRLLGAVKDKYWPDDKVPYHNFGHAANVWQTMFTVLVKGRLASLYSGLQVLTVLVAALAHDMDHPGTNNQFQVKSGSTLALLYNDRSVLEMHHAASLFHILTDLAAEGH